MTKKVKPKVGDLVKLDIYRYRTNTLGTIRTDTFGIITDIIDNKNSEFADEGKYIYDVRIKLFYPDTTYGYGDVLNHTWRRFSKEPYPFEIITDEIDKAIILLSL